MNHTSWRGRLVHAVLAATVSLLAAAPVAATQAMTTEAATLDIPAAEAHFVDLLNADRAANGLPALVINPTLMNLARDGQMSVCGQTVRGRSQDMVDRNYFSHQAPPCGAYIWPAMSAAGVNYTGAGENIGWNNYPAATTVDQMEQVLINSPGHRANILGDFNQVGVGIAAAPGPWTGGGGSFGGVVIYTQVFAKGPLPVVPPAQWTQALVRPVACSVGPSGCVVRFFSAPQTDAASRPIIWRAPAN